MKMSKFEKKFGKYAIPNLTLVLIGCYVIGYVIQLCSLKGFDLTSLLTLDPYRILHGEIWRLFTWLLIPPSSLDIFTILMLLLYYNLGTALEKTWGTYRYNVYIFSGILFTIVASFLCFGYFYFTMGKIPADMLSQILLQYSDEFSTYYINLSIFLAFAMTYPDMQVLLMFVIPVKVKWMSILYLVMMGYMLIAGNVFTKFAVGAALLNVGIFYLSTRNLFHMSPKQMKRRSDFRKEVRQNTKITRHKCAICGRTEEDAPELEFRFCSKCNGNYEYCQNHLFTHEHVK